MKILKLTLYTDTSRETQIGETPKKPEVRRPTSKDRDLNLSKGSNKEI